MTRRVVVTGLGAVSPIGQDMPTTWEQLLAGESGVAPITSYDASAFKVKVAAEVKDFVPPAGIDAKALKHMDRNSQFGVAAALEALADAGLSIKEEERERVGVIFGSGGGGMATTFRWYEAFRQRGPRRVSPFAMSNFIADAASGHIAIQTGALGPNYSPTSACATGTNAVGDGFSTIKLGRADAVIVGGSEAVVLPFLHACFEMMGVLAPETEPPAAACRPFDLRRKGFVPGEGGCALILEELGRAEARGAEIYAEVLGFGSSNDAHDMVASDASARGLRNALWQALREAGVSGDRVGYVNTHGTATQLNDRVETRAIKEIFGPHAQEMLVSSIKAATGHMMSASGALECAVVALALKRGLIPPTLNYETYDPDCDIDCVPNEAREVQLEAAVSTSVGLGGHNAAVLLRRWNGA
ncbi:MAG: beta-ketoacyl-ACP synthase II [Chloroflexi bacterium]|nr:beta-ketoacyl-ACP synthase II [Chloroflexota bacterium]